MLKLSRTRSPRERRQDEVIELTDDEKASSRSSPSKRSRPMPPNSSGDVADSNACSMILRHDGSSSHANSESDPGIQQDATMCPPATTEYGTQPCSVISIDDTITEFPSVRQLLQMPRDAKTARREFATQHSAEILSSDEADCDRLKLGRFAYVAPAPSSRRSYSVAGPSRSTSVTPGDAANPPKKPKQRKAPYQLADLREADFAKVMKCVCCDLSWTTRKTVSQKMKHIQSCAKKHSLTEETLSSLLRHLLQDLAEKSAAASQTGAGATTAIGEVNADAGTLLESALDGVVPKKKGRRRQVIQTQVKTLGDTRDSILDRARDLLRDSVAKTPAIALASETIEESEKHRRTMECLNDSEAPPLTQAFGDSALAKRPGGRKPQVALSMPPPTQIFGRSKLLRNEKAHADHLDTSGAQPSSEDSAYDYVGEDVYSDASSQNTEDIVDELLNSDDETGSRSRDKDFNTNMRKAILADPKLHRQVLRYEPVPFEVFNKLALKAGFPSRGLELRVRSFLDEQAIHFHGTDVKRGRKKKRR
ncbi:hypothetical protein OBBRIDRAFT_127131 [Obba rivulosa]|uniref:Uncharacterized protein n=1 Tax=Obba rivulosa TaxID=1052685 RepID=A0A8E2DI84_9APHY|nr:hypothetical protein OBBRIDRAFT_127131 [Obba rivulosa]